MTELIVNTDGGARGNPGPAACAFILRNSAQKILHSQGFYIGITTNNQAEYQGVIHALSWLIQNYNSPVAVAFYLDSLLVVNQLKGLYKIKQSGLQQLHQQVKILEQKLKSFTSESSISYQHIPRGLNSSADALVNQTLDSR